MPRATRSVPIPFRPDFDLTSTLVAGGFHPLSSVEEQIEFVFPDERAWWDWAWSNGIRSIFEALSPPDLEELRQEAFRELADLRTSDGVRLPQTARFVVANKVE